MSAKAWSIGQDFSLYKGQYLQMKQSRAKHLPEIILNCNIQHIYSEHLKSSKILQ